MRNRLAGQVAWISGAASGIGEATARLFANEGASVVIADVADGQALADEINTNGGNAVYNSCDVADSDSVARSIDTAVEQFGGLNIVVNNAGIVHVGLLHEYSLDVISMLGFEGVDIGLFEGRSHLHPSTELDVEYVWIDWEHCNEVDNLTETILFRDFIRSRSN